MREHDRKYTTTLDLPHWNRPKMNQLGTLAVCSRTSSRRPAAPSCVVAPVIAMAMMKANVFLLTWVLAASVPFHREPVHGQDQERVQQHTKQIVLDSSSTGVFQCQERLQAAEFRWLAVSRFIQLEVLLDQLRCHHRVAEYLHFVDQAAAALRHRLCVSQSRWYQQVERPRPSHPLRHTQDQPALHSRHVCSHPARVLGIAHFDLAVVDRCLCRYCIRPRLLYGKANRDRVRRRDGITRQYSWPAIFLSTEGTIYSAVPALHRIQILQETFFYRHFLQLLSSLFGHAMPNIVVGNCWLCYFVSNFH